MSIKNTEPLFLAKFKASIPLFEINLFISIVSFDSLQEQLHTFLLKSKDTVKINYI